MEMQEIHIDWDGPFSHEEAVDKFDDDKKDYGIYQIYGTHPVYGSNTLLYIGMADQQTLSKRISQHEYRFGKYWTPSTMSVFVGRPMGNTPNPNEWSREIRMAEKILIYVHSPAWNCDGLRISLTEESEEFNVHVFNWGKYGKLLPETSGKRYAFFDLNDTYYSL